MLNVLHLYSDYLQHITSNDLPLCHFTLDVIVLATERIT